MVAAKSRLLVTLVTLLAFAVFAGSSAGSARQPQRSIQAANALESGVLAQINALRARRGLARLRISRRLTAAADAHSREMGRRGFFSHSSADGTSFWRRVRRYYGAGGYGFWSVGENLLWASPDVDPAGALRMWMNSPGHRKILLTARWREVGLSAVRVSSAPGTFNGLDVTILTADFGVRR